LLIDFHVHVGRIHREFTLDFAKEMMHSCNKPIDNMDVNVDNLLLEMDQNKIEKSVLLAFDAQRTLDVCVPNEYVADICKSYPDRFVGFASFDGKKISDKYSVKTEVKKNCLSGYKLASCYLSLSPSDHCWYPLYGDALERNLPVLVHMGYTPIKKANLNYGHPQHLKKVLEDFPDLKLVIAHMGFPWVTETIELLKNYKNVYSDLSIVSYYQPDHVVFDIFSKAQEEGVINKLIWGTDYPMCTMTESLNKLDNIKMKLHKNNINIRKDQWNSIFENNAKYLLSDL